MSMLSHFRRPQHEHFEPDTGNDPQAQRRLRGHLEQIDYTAYASNREVVGFYDPRYPVSQNYPQYPLLELWNKGLPLTLCTDNPGISRTTLAEEYLTAAAMTHYQLSLWDVLAMVKQGFVHSFLSGSSKEILLKQVDAQLYQLISEPSS